MMWVLCFLLLIKTITFYCVVAYNKMKKKYHTVGTFPKNPIKKITERGKIDTLTHKYPIAHFSNNSSKCNEPKCMKENIYCCFCLWIMIYHPQHTERRHRVIVIYCMFYIWFQYSGDSL